MTLSYRIRTMKPSELSIAINWAKAEGWNPGLYDHETFLAADPNGFFIGEYEQEVISVGSMVNYDQHSSFSGLYIVKKPYRHHGYGLALTDYRLQYAGSRNIGLDGVLENVAIYERKGYRPYYKSQRFQHIGRSIPVFDPHLQPITLDLLREIIDYDQDCFFGKRDDFLKKWLFQPEITAVAYIQNEKVLGYGVCRACFDGYRIGPLFADSPEIADTLFQALQNDKLGKPIYFDAPEINSQAQRLAEKYHMLSVFACMRMYNRFLPDLNYQKIFGITTFELG